MSTRAGGLHTYMYVTTSSHIAVACKISTQGWEIQYYYEEKATTGHQIYLMCMSQVVSWSTDYLTQGSLNLGHGSYKTY